MDVQIVANWDDKYGSKKQETSRYQYGTVYGSLDNKEKEKQFMETVLGLTQTYVET